MPVIGFDHYNLRADRATLDTLRDFYVNVVGLEPGYRPPFQSSGYWLYAGAQAILHLSEARPGEARPAHVVNTFDHVAFSCANAADMERRLVDAQVRYARRYVPVTSQLQIFFTDPAGNGVELNFAEAGGDSGDKRY
ncbi:MULTISPECIES: VOC family protein [unclassified Burkholderia]|uniref:VOC family protein n=1 Tax=unclassified Burkholderia TaxID=2613784 RepID=UPI000F58D83D|nr:MULTISPECIES: VOC family protein [unclassified Burkholderia]RQR29132.1 diguanylate cyclase [Burkholderia sp. Bp9131]RQR79536.1 diguanylate cyclase [Burkholderia sp. Bp9015]RQR96358.1 diguanylate cyclase [Burkholderia sp. Bp8994]RQS25373.1 diguanylate cyclase [Burkholderia sp. Bp8995]RQS44978.1 diguanylate cyclase [Burkholderia sp. Bp8989]